MVSNEFQQENGLSSLLSGISLSRIMSFSFLASFFSLGSSSSASDGAKLFVFGLLLEIGRRSCQWIYERFDVFQYSITAEFDEGDSTYEWIILFLTEAQVWKRSRNFHVTTATSKRTWGIRPTSTESATETNASADYVPTYEAPQLFRWNGYWAEIKRNKQKGSESDSITKQLKVKLYLTIYTRNMSALSDFVEEAKKLYMRKSKPHVIIHSLESESPRDLSWSSTAKSRRSLNSVILPDGILSSIVADARAFLGSEDWYRLTGIPYRRGYLLHGPPGTGKSSTIYALAGELGLEIYCISLAAAFMDDAFLLRAARSIPKQAIFLIEDIDCAFPSREKIEEIDKHMSIFGVPVFSHGKRIKTTAVTLSGLLNVLDGVESEEGKIFFATTNYIDRLDPALIRPGRIDKKIKYYLSTRSQAEAVFIRFYPLALTSFDSELKSPPMIPSEKESHLAELASKFASSVPEEEFSVAELQGYLLAYKEEPELAATCIAEWVERERTERREAAKKIKEMEIELKEKKDLEEVEKLQSSMEKLGQKLNSSKGIVINGISSTPVDGNASNESPALVPQPTQSVYPLTTNSNDNMAPNDGPTEDEVIVV